MLRKAADSTGCSRSETADASAEMAAPTQCGSGCRRSETDGYENACCGDSAPAEVSTPARGRGKVGAKRWRVTDKAARRPLSAKNMLAGLTPPTGISRSNAAVPVERWQTLSAGAEKLAGQHESARRRTSHHILSNLPPADGSLRSLLATLWARANGCCRMPKKIDRAARWQRVPAGGARYTPRVRCGRSATRPARSSAFERGATGTMC